MKGVTLMELVLTTVCVVCILAIIAVKFIRPQDHAFQDDFSEMLDRIETLENANKNAEFEHRLAYSETKFNQVNNEILKLTSMIDELREETDKDFDDAHEHINRVFNNVKSNAKAITALDKSIESTVDVRIKNNAPLLVQMIHDQNLRTYTVEKWKRTKDGYKKMSMSKVMPAKKETIKKLKLPGVEESKRSMVDAQL